MEDRFIDPDILNEVWKDFYEERWGEMDSWFRDYAVIARSSQKATKFEDWLYEQGATVIQMNSRRYISFRNNDTAVMFMLKYKR